MVVYCKVAIPGIWWPPTQHMVVPPYLPIDIPQGVCYLENALGTHAWPGLKSSEVIMHNGVRVYDVHMVFCLLFTTSGSGCACLQASKDAC